MFPDAWRVPLSPFSASQFVVPTPSLRPCLSVSHCCTNTRDNNLVREVLLHSFVGSSPWSVGHWTHCFWAYGFKHGEGSWWSKSHSLHGWKQKKGLGSYCPLYRHIPVTFCTLPIALPWDQACSMWAFWGLSRSKLRLSPSHIPHPVVRLSRAYLQNTSGQGGMDTSVNVHL